MQFSHRSCRDLNLQPFDHKPSTLYQQANPGSHLRCWRTDQRWSFLIRQLEESHSSNTVSSMLCQLCVLLYSYKWLLYTAISTLYWALTVLHDGNNELIRDTTNYRLHSPTPVLDSLPSLAVSRRLAVVQSECHSCWTSAEQPFEMWRPAHIQSRFNNKERGRHSPTKGIYSPWCVLGEGVGQQKQTFSAVFYFRSLPAPIFFFFFFFGGGCGGGEG